MCVYMYVCVYIYIYIYTQSSKAGGFISERGETSVGVCPSGHLLQNLGQCAPPPLPLPLGRESEARAVRRYVTFLLFTYQLFRV